MFERKTRAISSETLDARGTTSLVRLRNRRPGGFKFRRQHPIGTRIVEFFCEEAKIAIEIDGSGHRRHLGQYEDLDRELDLYERGIRVLRFSNRAVLSNLDRVVNEIIFAIDPERSLWATPSKTDAKCYSQPSP